MTVTKSGVMADLKAVDDAAVRIAATIGKLRAEQAALGGKAPANVASLIPGIRDEMKQVRAGALRRGVEPDLAALQGRLDTALARADEVRDLLDAAVAAETAVGQERLALLVDRHEEFLDAAVAEVAIGEKLLATAAAACLDVGDQRAIAQAALRLAFDGHIGNAANKTHEQEQQRKADWRSFTPWAQTNSPESNALWSAIQTITTPPPRVVA
jgi:hypothetical protein